MKEGRGRPPPSGRAVLVWCLSGLALGSFCLSVIRTYLLLKQRRRLVMSFQGAPYVPTKDIVISQEEFERCLTGIADKVPNHAEGMMSLGPSVVHRVMREPSTFLGGGVASLLQVAHPFVAKGIYDHSKVLVNPVLRFERTFHYVFRINFGGLDTAMQAARSVRKLHNRISGSLSQDTGVYKEGEGYTAHDQEAVKWVFATLYETSMFTHELVFGRLSEEEKDEVLRFAREASVFFGLDPSQFPDTYSSFKRYYFGMCHSPLLKVTSEGQEICDAIMRPLLWERYLGINSLKTVTGVLMPEPVALQFGFSVSNWSYAYAAFFLTLFRLVYRMVPGRLRYLTPYLASQARKNQEELGLLPRLFSRLASTFVSAALSSQKVSAEQPPP